LFPTYEVRPVNDPNIEYDVFDKGERILFVVPNDDGSVFNVHATSGKVSITDHAWRVGQAFQGSTEITKCECWGDTPTCYKTGEHVAVNFDRDCTGLTDANPRALKVLDGLVVQRVIWSPTAFGNESKGPAYGGDTYGQSGDPCGGGGADPCAGP
jgi:hypothetical protein